MSRPMLKDLVDQIRALQRLVELAEAQPELQDCVATAAPLVERLHRMVEEPVLGVLDGPDAPLFYALARFPTLSPDKRFEQLADEVRAAMCGWFRAVVEHDPGRQQRAERALQQGLDSIYALGRSGGGR